MSNISNRTYADAINRLNSLQSNAAVIESIRQSGGKGGDAQLLETVEYLQRIGYKVVRRWTMHRLIPRPSNDEVIPHRQVT